MKYFISVDRTEHWQLISFNIVIDKNVKEDCTDC